MTADDLREVYRGYIACLNVRHWASLGRYVGAGVRYNGKAIGLAGYRAMLEADVQAIPDLQFQIEQTVCEPPFLACRLQFDCTPPGMLFDLPVNGRRVRFAETVFYEFGEGQIVAVHSIIDKASIAAQL